MRVLLSVIMGLVLSGSLVVFADTDSQATIQTLAQSLKLDDLSMKAVEVADQTTTETLADNDTRDVHQIQLVHSEVGSIQINMNGPKNFSLKNTKYPTLFVIADSADSTKILRLLRNPENLILVSYSYPGADALRVIPGQIALALEWLKARKYVDAKKLGILALDLSSELVPMSLRLAKFRGVTPASTVMLDGANNQPLKNEELAEKIIGALESH